jgi:hypothetical protein
VVEEPAENRDWIGWFQGWFNSPAVWYGDPKITSGVVNGIPTARLGIFPGGF